MNLDELFQMDPEEIDQLYENANIEEAVLEWLEHDPTFLTLMHQLEYIDKKAVQQH